MARPHTRTRSTWTDAEVALLRELYPSSPAKARAALPDRTREAIRVCARKLGIVAIRRHIGQELLKALEEGPGTAEELSIEIDHPINTVSARLVQMYDNGEGVLERESIPGRCGTRYIYSLKEG